MTEIVERGQIGGQPFSLAAVRGDVSLCLGLAGGDFRELAIDRGQCLPCFAQALLMFLKGPGVRVGRAGSGPAGRVRNYNGILRYRPRLESVDAVRQIFFAWSNLVQFDNDSETIGYNSRGRRR